MLQIASSPEQIAWAAGLFEGEGCFTLQRSRRIKSNGEEVTYVQPVARVQSTDGDVVESIYRIVGFGVFWDVPRKENGLGTKLMYQWATNTAPETATVYHFFRPWLHERRKARGRKILVEYLTNQLVMGKEVCDAKEVLRALDL